MAKLDAKQRAKLPAKDFGLPEKARSAGAKKDQETTRSRTKGMRSAPSGFLQSSARKAISQRTSSSASTARPTRS